MPTNLNQLRPDPENEYLAAAWQHSAMRYAMMKGEWREYANTRLGDFFAPEVADQLPPAEMGGNPALSITLQLSTLYDEDPLVAASRDDGTPVSDDDLAALDDPRGWSIMQDVLESVNGMNDCAVLTGYAEGRGLYWKIAQPNEYVEESDPDRPDQPSMMRHLELSKRPKAEGDTSPPIVEWTWTTWVKGDPGAFKVEAVVPDEKRKGAQTTEDVTAIYYPKEAPDGSRYPFWTGSDGDSADSREPIWPWVIYHRRVTQRTRNTYAGREIWEGTLTFSSLQTFWLSGVRDGAHPQRYAVDAEPSLVGTKDINGSGVQTVRMNQTAVMMFRSVQGDSTSAKLGEFRPGMDPKASGEAIAAFGASLAVYAGIAPQDISISGGAVGMSGYAIALSRDGQRRARRKLEVPMGQGDRLRLSQTAQLLNAYTDGAELPESPDSYRVTYASPDRSMEQRTADREEALALRSAGILNVVDMYIEAHPGTTREEAVEQIVRNAEEEQEIARRIGALSPPPPIPEPSEPEITGEGTAEVTAEITA